MKVCPECRSRYEGDISFCPTDGTRLVDISHVAENWTGRDLDDSLHLGDFWESTPAGDRYIAHDDVVASRLLGTLLNRRGRLETDVDDQLRALLSDAPPETVLALRRYDLRPDNMPPWIVEEHPELSSLRHRLDDHAAKEAGFKWEVGVRIAISAGRTLHWMAKRGHIHRMWHPGATYIDESGETVKIGDWLIGDVLFAETEGDVPEELGARWVGFTDYMAPELFDGVEPDPASLVYALGIVLFETIVGEPPFSDADDIEQAHSSADRPHIQSEVSGVHPDIDDILPVMLAPDPDDRFDHPEAAAAALASLLSSSLKTVAPDLEDRASRVFPDDEPVSKDVSTDAGDDASSETIHELSDPVDASEQSATSDSSETKETLLGMPAADSTPSEESDNDTSDGERESVLSGESESIDTSGSDTGRPSDEVPTIIIDDDDDDTDDLDETDGMAETVVEPDDASSQTSQNAESTTDRFARIRTGTLRAWQRNGERPLLEEDLSVSVIGFVDVDGSSGKPKLRRTNFNRTESEPAESDHLAPTVPDDDAGPPDIPASERSDSTEVSGQTTTSGDDERDADDKPDIELRESDVSDSTDVVVPDDEDAPANQSAETETRTHTPDESGNRRADDEEEDFAGVISDFDRGSQEIDDPDDFENEWFSKSSEDAWMEQNVQEGRDRAEETRRNLLYAGLAILLVFALSIVLYAEFGPANSPDQSEKLKPPTSKTSTSNE